jgi:hypothetical protein
LRLTKLGEAGNILIFGFNEICLLQAPMVSC